MLTPLPGVYLRPLPAAPLAGRHSAGARRRAVQLQRFLAPLHALALEELGWQAEVELLVAAPADWRALTSARYALPLTRRALGAAQVLAPADRPPRLLHRLDEPLAAAVRAGTPPPGEAGELVDLLTGPVWGRTLLIAAGQQSRLRWLDDLLGSYIFALAMLSASEGPLERWRAWAGSLRGAWQPQDEVQPPVDPGRRAAYEGVLGWWGLCLAERGWGLPGELQALLAGAERGAEAQALTGRLPELAELQRELGVGGWAAGQDEALDADGSGGRHAGDGAGGGGA